MLTGLRVVECAERIAGPFCGRLLARLGAEVVKVERPGIGDPARAAGPFRGDEPDLEGGGLFAYLNAGKRSVEADPATDDGWRTISRLLDSADLLIQDESPVAPAAANREVNADALIDLRIVTFGAPGPYAGYRAEPLNLVHAAGETSVLPGGGIAGGSPDRPPVQPQAPISEYDAGWTAASAAVAALFEQQATGRGARVEVSKYEAIVALGRIRHVAWLEGVELDRFSARYAGSGTFACADGFIQVLPSGARHWETLLRRLGLERFLTDDRFDFVNRNLGAAVNELQAAIAEALSIRSKEEVYRGLAEDGVPVGPFTTVADLFESRQLEHRGFFEEVPMTGGPVALPGLPFPADPAPAGPPPRLGEHNHLLAGGQ